MEYPFPRDNRLSSLGKPRDAIGDPQGRFFYPTLKLMVDSYSFHKNTVWGSVISSAYYLFH